MAIGRINASLSGVQPGGLAKIVPTSVAVGSGTGSVSANGTVSFSGVSSISLNGVFSSTYQNYRLVMLNSFSTSARVDWRLRNAGSDVTGASYAYNTFAASSTQTVQRSTGQTIGRLAVTGSDPQVHIYDIMDPFANTPTYLLGNDSVFLEVYLNATMYNANQTADSISFIPSAGTITGTVSIYGYN